MLQMSREYAEALFSLACEEQKMEEYGAAMDTVLGIFAENAEYVDLLSSPAISIGERLEIIDAAFSSLLPEHVLSFLKLLCEKMHLRSFADCVSHYNKLLSASKQIAFAKVISAVMLTPDEIEALRQKLAKMCGKSVELETHTEPSVLGGMIIEIDGKVIDASLRRHLSDVKDVISR